jgi:hypothetical protein
MARRQSLGEFVARCVIAKLCRHYDQLVANARRRDQCERMSPRLLRSEPLPDPLRDQQSSGNGNAAWELRPGTGILVRHGASVMRQRAARRLFPPSKRKDRRPEGRRQCGVSD